MTLLLTAITDKGIVFAADRNLNRVDQRTGAIIGLPHMRKKILPIEQHRAAIGYFGNAHVGRQKQLMDLWLENFLQENQGHESLEGLISSLKSSLESQLTPDQKNVWLGFHVAGFVEREGYTLPTFWHVRNIEGMRGPYYEGVSKTFRVSEDFLERDLSYVRPDKIYEYLRYREMRVYRNGTLTPYLLVAQHVDSMVRSIWGLRQQLGMHEFDPPSSLDGYAAVFRLHIDLTTRIYEHLSSSQDRPIGGGIDVIMISPDGVVTCDYEEDKQG